jgi:hypothetical protein
MCAPTRRSHPAIASAITCSGTYLRFRFDGYRTDRIACSYDEDGIRLCQCPIGVGRPEFGRRLRSAVPGIAADETALRPSLTARLSFVNTSDERRLCGEERLMRDAQLRQFRLCGRLRQ